MFSPLSRRSGIWFESIQTEIKVGIPSETLTLSEQAPITSPLYAQIPNEALSLTSESPTFKYNVSLPSISFTLEEQTPIGAMAFFIPNKTLSLTEKSPLHTYSPKSKLIFNFEDGLLPDAFTIPDGTTNGWSVVDTDAYQGTYCLKAGTITDSQYSSILLTQYCVAGTLSFNYKVGIIHQLVGDFFLLEFFVDGVRQALWSDVLDWDLYSITVTTGVHTFEWRLTNYSSRLNTSDTAWIDNITIPDNVYLAPSSELVLLEQNPSIDYFIIPTIAFSLIPNSHRIIFKIDIPSESLSLVSLPPKIGSSLLHTASYGTTTQFIHSATYESPAVFTLHESSWTLAAQVINESTYQSLIKSEVFVVNEASYQSSGGLTATFTLHESSYASTGSLSTEYVIHDITYGQADRITVNTLHESTYASSGSSLSIAALVHESSYLSSGGLIAALTTHDVSYGDANRISAFTIHTTIYASTGSLNTALVVHESSYLSTGSLSSVSVIHEASYLSAGSLSSVSVIHEASYLSTGSTTQSVFTTHDSIWSYSTAIQVIDEQQYRSVVTSSTTHTVAYWSTNFDQASIVHEAKYRSYNTDTQFILANAYILPDIQLVSAQVTADEDSPYYQCEIELRDSGDYRLFARDQAFTLRIFNDDYRFVVDSKRLSRSIDDAGNLIETVNLSGLSPLCLKASPRADTITKTWEVPTFAKTIVEELLGSVTWNFIDWMIPAYRLSAENADPLTIAQQVVNAAGGLIESQPNGSIVVRHRWPVSITALATNVAATLDETMIYSLSEAPTQDTLMDRIRILDSNAGYQDRLEYVSNELSDGSNSPWSGLLYAYLSPWRDGLSFATTRGSKIQLGGQSEGTRRIYDHPTDEEIVAEILTFENGQSSTQYPIMQINSVQWLDQNLGSLTYSPYSTTVEASQSGAYHGYSLAKVSYTTRYLQIPVNCTPSTTSIEAQFLLLENTNG